MGERNTKALRVMALIGAAAVLYFAVLIAPLPRDNLFVLFQHIGSALETPFSLRFCDSTLKTILILELIYGFFLLYYSTQRRNYRYKEEHGSARWEDPGRIRSKYADRKLENNKILSQNFRISLDTMKHYLWLHTMVIGATGSQKTRSIIFPALMQNNASVVCLDPKGESYRTVGKFLEEHGTPVKKLDVKDMYQSFGYNCFRYIRGDDDIQKVATILMKATTPRDSTAKDPFWDNMAELLLKALMSYVFYEAPEEERNFSSVMDMFRCGAVREGPDGKRMESVLDMIFKRLEMRDPDHIAVRFYNEYAQGAKDTVRSIRAVFISRFQLFEFDHVKALTFYDELNIPSLGEKKQALFLVVPDDDTSYNFIISIFYMQLFQQLSRLAEGKYRGRLPVPVHLLMDEAMNVELPADFPVQMRMMRSRNIFATIIIQDLPAIKAKFEKDWASIIGNCDTLVYLGSMDVETMKHLGELVGQETIDVIKTSRQMGSHGSFSTSYDMTGKQLIPIEKLRKMDRNKCVVLVRGEDPILDNKYNPNHHPNAKFTTLKGGEPYEPYTGIIGEANLALLDEMPETEGKSVEYVELLLPEELEVVEMIDGLPRP